MNSITQTKRKTSYTRSDVRQIPAEGGRGKPYFESTSEARQPELTSALARNAGERRRSEVSSNRRGVGFAPLFVGKNPQNRHVDDVTADGLVSCSKTREALEIKENWQRELWAPRFAPADLVSAATGLFKEHEAEKKRLLRSGDFAKISSELEDTYTGVRTAFRLAVSPGSIQFKTSKLFKYAEDIEKSPADLERELEELLEQENQLPLELEEPEERPENFNKVTEWSRKSRANMVRRLATLDYSPWTESGRIPALVTLTLPANWLQLMPDGRKAQAKFEAWRKRYEYDWNEPLSAIWKREFQRRGAPHWHLLFPPPQHVCKKTGETFKDWLSRTWAEVCGATGENFEKHLRAGTGIDYAEGVRARDPKRLAIYFLKKESGASGESSKEYQHRVPDVWAGKPVGRFWGYFRLQPVIEEVELTPEDALNAKRILRRWSRAKGLTKQVRRPRTRTKVNKETGEVTQVQFVRKITVRSYYFKGAGGGFACLNSGPGFAAQLARALDIMRRTE